MLLNANCGKSGQNNLISCMMLPVGVVLCRLGQYRVFPPLTAIIATRRRGMLATRRCRRSSGILPIYPAGLGGVHQESGAGCPYWWLHGLIHPKYALWGCSLAILQAAPSRWRCPDEGNQGLPEQCAVCRYRRGSCSYPRNAAWQRALRCFTKCL